MCLVLFFLPWVDVQCPMPKNLDLDKPNAAPPKSSDMVWSSIITQSGMQAATGGYSFSNPQLRAMADMDKGGKKGKGGEKDGPKAAPLLWLYLLAAIAGIGVGFAMPSTNARKYALAACCGTALLAAGGQAVIGFPIKTELEKDLKDGKGGMGGLGGLGDVGGAGGGAKKAEPKLDDFIRVNFQLWFYLALLFPVGGLATALIEPTRPGGKKGSKEPYGDVADADEPPMPLDDEPEEKPKPRGGARSGGSGRKDDQGPRGGGDPDPGSGGNPFANLG